MRRVILIVVILGLIVAGTGVYLAVTTPNRAEGVRFPLRAAHRDLLARVPASADAFALVPTAAALHAELLTNPIARGPVEAWTEKQPHLPSPWMIGRADVVAWKIGKETSYAIRLDPVRAFLVRISTILGGPEAVRWDGTTLLMTSGAEAAMGAEALAPLLAVAQGLPQGDALVFQREGRSGDGFPPVGRPAASVVSVDANEILITSRAVAETVSGVAPRTAPRLAHDAMLSGWFAQPPRILGDLNRLFGTKVSSLLDTGGSIAMYGIDTGTLLPRPNLVIAAPSAPGTTDRLRDLAQLVGETEERGGETLVSFDRSSLRLYLKDGFAEPRWPVNQWAVRMRPRLLIPVLERLSNNPAIRYGTPRIHRAARDLRRWVGALQEAEVVEAASSTEAGHQVLRVRIASK